MCESKTSDTSLGTGVTTGNANSLMLNLTKEKNWEVESALYFLLIFHKREWR